MLVCAGGTQRAAHFSAEEPVQNTNQDSAENDQYNNRVIRRQRTHIAGRNQQAVLVHADRQVGFTAAGAGTHNAQIDRVERQLCEDTGQNSRYPAGGMEQTCDQACQHADQRSRQKRHTHRYAVQNQHNTDRAAGAQRAVNGQIGHIQNTVGNIDADGHNAPDETLCHSTGHGVYQRG